MSVALGNWSSITRNSLAFCSSNHQDSIWFSALRLQVIVLRNAAGSIACAWIPNACFALGNIFSGKDYSHQSNQELVVANSVWTAITFCTVGLVSFLPLMACLRLIKFPDRSLSWWFWLKKVVRASFHLYIIAVVIAVALGYLAAYLVPTRSSISEYKIDVYLNILQLMGFFLGVEREVKKIYYEETCQGRDRLASKRQKVAKIQVLPSLTPAGPPRYHRPKFWQVYMRNLPALSPTLLACVFVHILSRQRIVDGSTTVLVGFVVGGVTFKIAIQELAKHFIFKKRVQSSRVMSVLVGVPTVLIDTQMRIIMLGTNSTSTVSTSTFSMALIEICLRAGKAANMKYTIRQRKMSLKISSNKRLASVDNFQLNAETTIGATRNVLNAPPQSIVSTSKDFEIWRRRVQAFHTVELNADMYAEYIAIGCSAAILFFNGDHPYYSLLRQSGLALTGTDMAAWRTGQLYMLIFQIGVEVVVDYVCIALELTIGVEFDRTKHLGSLLGGLFMFTAVINVIISVNMYIH